MDNTQLFNEIVEIIESVRNDYDKLEQVYKFLTDEIIEPEQEIPEKYRNIVSEIADLIGGRFVCYLNPDTLEHEYIPESLIDEIYWYDDTEREKMGLDDLKHDSWAKCITFEPLESRESFIHMEQFTEQLPDKIFANKLFNALKRKKPFANFKYLVDNSPYRQDWFDFRQQRLEQYVYDIIWMETEKTN